MSSNRKIFGPFNRVEGDLEVEVEIDNGVVKKAWVNSPLYRGFEQILHGKDPRDALVYTPRICGICSVSQSVAAAQALAEAQGIEPTPNGRLSSNLILACENLADHLSHFYLFFMPDFAREAYTDKNWHEETARRFKAQTGAAFKTVLPARAQWLHITGILAGKWPHSLSIQPGGSTRSVESQERVRLIGILGSFREFLEITVFGGELEAIAELDSERALTNWCDNNPGSDLSRFMRISHDLELDSQGHAGSLFMSYGAYQTDADQHLFRRGIWNNGSAGALDVSEIREDISHSWMQSQPGPRHPYQGTTLPDADMSNSYSWCKAPRLDGEVVEVGAVARQLVNQHPLIVDLVSKHGGCVQNRIIARLLELALVVPAMENWMRMLRPREPFCNHAPLPDDAQGAGLVEAARGSLGHWLRIKNGRILNYQIIAPTTWNFSPRDNQDVPGALEQALTGTEVGENGKESLMIQHIVRSFDPCMVCTVH